MRKASGMQKLATGEQAAMVEVAQHTNMVSTRDLTSNGNFRSNVVP